jgi:hypothetical protein
MSKLGCKCGHIIRDQTCNIPYKGHVLPDVRHATFFDWLAEEMQSYVKAAQTHRVEQWLLDRLWAGLCRPQAQPRRRAARSHLRAILHAYARHL